DALHFHDTRILDLSPLKSVALRDLRFDFQPYRDADLLRSVRVHSINTKVADEFWKEVDARQAAFEAWCKEVAGLEPGCQVRAVIRKLQELNRDFDGRLQEKPKIENGTVLELVFSTDQVTDISPLRALAGLKWLRCDGSVGGKGRLSDLWPLKGMA